MSTIAANEAAVISIAKGTPELKAPSVSYTGNFIYEMIKSIALGWPERKELKHRCTDTHKEE